MKQILYLLMILIFVASCSKERPFKPVLEDGRRVEKAALQGQYVFLKSVLSAPYGRHGIAGEYVDHDLLVEFRIQERTLNVVATHQIMDDATVEEKPRLLASFPVRHVDLLRKQNSDGLDTHEEEETDKRRPWYERRYLVVDLDQDLVARDRRVRSAQSSSLKIENNYLEFSLHSILDDGGERTEKYSFLKYHPTTYRPREYPRFEQSRFGYFKTTRYQYDAYGRPVSHLKKDYANAWDTSKDIVYYFSKNFPSHLKSAVQKVFDRYNEVFKKIIGRPLLQLHENTGQEIGDLRFNLIAYMEEKPSIAVLGYGPSVTNPLTGEPIKADVFLYGSTFKHALYKEKELARLLKDPPRPRPFSILEKLFRNFDFSWDAFKKLSNKPFNFDKFNSEFSIEKELSRLREHRRDCAWEANSELAFYVGDKLESNSDAALEAIIFAPLVAHELGHNLGLRHNFMGSVDEIHFENGTKSSSAMEYTTLSHHSPQGPGPYDRAALTHLYGSAAAKQALREDAFQYCSDENNLDSRHGLCHAHDTGTSLTKVAEGLMKNYISSYYFNNLKLDLIQVPFSESRYQSIVFQHLMGLRMVWDYAHAILEPKDEFQFTKDDVEFGSEALLALWKLARQKIEANQRTEKRIKTVLPVDGAEYEISIDPQKIQSLFADAEKAKLVAFSALSLVIRNDPRLNILNPKEEREDFDGEHELFEDELEVRGVLVDRILAAKVMNLPTPSPSEGGKSLRMLTHQGTEVYDLMRQFLTNTSLFTMTGDKSVITDFKMQEPNVRNFLWKEFFQLLESNQMDVSYLKETIAFAKKAGTPAEKENATKIEELRKEYRDVLTQLVIAEEPKKQEDLRAKLRKNRKEYQAISEVYFTLRNGTEVKAPLELPNKLRTVAGTLLRDNLYSLEDKREAYLGVADQLRAANKKLKNISPESLEQNIKNLQKVIDFERNNIEKLVHHYFDASFLRGKRF